MAKSMMKRTNELFSRGRKNKAKSTTSKANDGAIYDRQRETVPASRLRGPSVTEDDDSSSIVIVGAGIVGLVLALAIDKHCEGAIKVELYEQAQAFHDDVGAGMGMYPNGLRVIRDISPDLLTNIQQAGYPYLLRRYERHDGTDVATSSEAKLLGSDAQDGGADDELQPIGIRRWRLQKILFEAVQHAGIRIHFNKRLQIVEQVQVVSSHNESPSVRLTFQDGTIRTTQLLIGCDGSKSQVRTLVSHGEYKLQYTGTTCLMGTSTVPRQVRGLCLPSSETTKCHGAFYPTGEHEQCFQFHFPTATDGRGEQQTDETHHSVDPKDVSWGGLTHAVEQEECNKLADRLIEDGWDEKFIQPLRKVDKALKVGFMTLEPHLKSYVFGRRNIVLVGDSAHPPVPYLGQGAQQGLEDAGTLALLLKHYCVRQPVEGSSAKFSLDDVNVVLELYDQMRLPRTVEILNRAKLWGKQQQKRADSRRYNRMREEIIRREVFYHETLPELLPAVRHDYQEEALAAIRERDVARQERTEHRAGSKEQSFHKIRGNDNARSVQSECHHLVPVPEETVCH